MEWNIYKDWLDPVLYRQMVSMIYQLSSNADKEAFLKQERENSLFYGICERSMEEEYNLHYPGEVLERMKERRTMTKPGLPGSWLALAGTSCIQETCMFNGTQKKRLLETVWQGTWRKGFVLPCSPVSACNKRSQALGGCPAPVSI